MKLLITYDGSDCAVAALSDLRYAGLPHACQVVVLSVGDPATRTAGAAASAGSQGQFVSQEYNWQALHDQAIVHAQIFVAQGAALLKKQFPSWQIETQALMGSAQSIIVRKAVEWRPDLVVLGSHGRSGFHNVSLGSVSQHVANHTYCSVRIGRNRPRPAERPLRILVGMDESSDAAAALESITARSWPADTQLRVAGVIDLRSPLLMPSRDAPSSSPSPAILDALRESVSLTVQKGVAFLARAGLRAEPQVLAGSPGYELVGEAERWDADAIFVGARSINAFERIFLGSVSTAVVTRASCAVEVVRQPD